MLRSAFKPGDSVPEPRCFWVNHYQHRLAHLATVLFDFFPECAQCGNKVRFETATPREGTKVDLLRDDRDFCHAREKASAKGLRLLNRRQA
jgi:hypothetical protein